MDVAPAIAAINAGLGDRLASPNPGQRKLALCFDGTWNSLESQTNVSRLFRAIGTAASGCPGQLSFYDSGVGTRWSERLRGGVFGYGLDRNVKEGYCWLCNTYASGAPEADDDDPSGELFDRGDRIYLFGFSRGAYTARSLAGLVNRVGLIDPARIDGGRAPLTPQTPAVEEAWNLYRNAKAGPGVHARDLPKCVAFRRAHSFTVKIAMVGVWDTVGALGVPKFRAPIPLPFGEKYRFHDTTLGRVIESAYHAMAIDEQRCDYSVTMWTRPDDRLWARRVEQRWFPGAHANVGGGYDGDLLCDPPLLWMAQKAAGEGLRFNMRGGGCDAVAPAEFALDGSEYLSPVRDSYAEFMGGLYPFVSPAIDGGRSLRRMMVEADGMNQTIDLTAWLKWDADSRYRPINLARAGRETTGGQA